VTESQRRAVLAWLYAGCLLIALLVTVGGVTRLTGSGLSITEWKVLMGTLPPLNAEAWHELWQKYQATPQYQQVNTHFTLEQFKTIFWWEYIHRLLGRVIGLVFLLPFLYFLLRKKLERPLVWKLGGIFLLGALQGALGWFMVKSGLVDDPRVSHFRLTAHLGVALAIFAAQFWIALGLLSERREPFSRTALALPLVTFAMALSGGLVAGLRAGYAYNTFPLMNGYVIPPEVLSLEPWWQNFFYNMATVQLVHRGFFWLLAVLVPLAWWRHRAAAPANVLMAAFVLQASLGISTLLLRVPVALGAMHQGGAVLLLAAALWFAHSCRESAPVRHARALA